MSTTAPNPARVIATLTGIVGILLLIPLTAMQFTDQVNWSPVDFVLAGILLLVSGLAVAFLIVKTGQNRHRPIVGLMAVLLMALIWGELAVGLFGTPWAGT